jgi:hypothetical protein
MSANSCLAPRRLQRGRVARLHRTRLENKCQQRMTPRSLAHKTPGGFSRSTAQLFSHRAIIILGRGDLGWGRGAGAAPAVPSSCRANSAALRPPHESPPTSGRSHRWRDRGYGRPHPARKLHVEGTLRWRQSRRRRPTISICGRCRPKRSRLQLSSDVEQKQTSVLVN